LKGRNITTPKALVIDDLDNGKPDEELILGKLPCLLERAGLAFAHCKSGEEGLGALKADIGRDFRVVLLDVLFPGQRMDGEAIFAEIRNLREDLPIVILTRLDSWTEAQGFQDRGALNFFVKQAFADPAQKSKFLNQLRAVCKETGVGYRLILRKNDRDCTVRIQDVENGLEVVRISVGYVEFNMLIKLADRAQSHRAKGDLPERYVGWVKGNEWEGICGPDTLEPARRAWALNKRIFEESEGQIPALIESDRRGGRGRRLAVRDIMIEESP